MTSEKNNIYVQVVTSRIGGGAELLVRELHARIAAKGHESRAIYFNTGSEEVLAAGEITLNLSPRNPMAVVALRKIFKNLIKNHNNVVLHAHLTWPFVYVALAAMFLNVKLVYTEHNTTNRRRNFLGARWFDALFYSRYSRIICISAGVSKALSVWVGSKLQDRLIMVSNGSRLFQLKPRKLEHLQSVKLVSVGSLSRKKGFGVALEAVALLGNSIESYVIIGEGPDRLLLEALIKKLGVADKVQLVGWTDDIESGLHNAHIQLIPSLWEGFGLVAVEGMSTGLPIIASDVQGLREVLDPSNPAVKLISSHRQADKWADAIIEMAFILRNQVDFQVSTEARIQAEKYSLEKMVDSYIEVYEGLDDESLVH